MKIEMKFRCSELWEAMPLAGDGRYCQRCEKEIVDFSDWSDAKIAAELKSGKSLCGRIHSSRLERPLQIEKPKSSPVWALSILSALATSPSLFAQDASSLSPREALKAQGFTAVELAEFAETGNTELKRIAVKGRVLESNYGQGAALAQLALFSGESLLAHTQADLNGFFNVSFERTDTLRSIKFEVSCVGYENSIAEFGLDALKDSIIIPLELESINPEENHFEHLVMGYIVSNEAYLSLPEEKKGNWLQDLAYRGRNWFIRQRYRLFP